MARVSTPSAACWSRAQRPDRSHQPRQPCRCSRQQNAAACRLLPRSAHCTTLPLSGRPNRCEELQPVARSADDSHSIASALCLATPPEARTGRQRGSANARGALGVSSPRRRDFCRPRAGDSRQSDALQPPSPVGRLCRPCRLRRPWRLGIECGADSAEDERDRRRRPTSGIAGTTGTTGIAGLPWLEISCRSKKRPTVSG